MQLLPQIIFTTLLASTFAAPGLFLDTHLVHAPVKSTLTKSSQLVDHGSTTIVHTPVINVHTVHAVPVHISQTTVTKNSQLVNHGGHEIHTIPIVHQPVHTVIHEPVHIAHVATHVVPVKTKTTVTKNSQVVNHGGHKVVHVPVHHEVQEHLVASVPVDYHKATSSQFFKLDNVVVPHVELAKVSRSGDSAVSHHSSTVHETEVKSLPLYTLHH